MKKREIFSLLLGFKELHEKEDFKSVAELKAELGKLNPQQQAEMREKQNTVIANLPTYIWAHEPIWDKAAKMHEQGTSTQGESHGVDKQKSVSGKAGAPKEDTAGNN